MLFQYNQEIIELVKQVPGRRWNNDDKIWTIPKSHLGMLINQFKGTVYESQVNIVSSENINVTESLDVSVSIPDVDISDFKFQVEPGKEPYKHQLDFIKYAATREGQGFFLGDDMRLGKSLEVLNLALYRKQHSVKNRYGRCLIICNVATSRFNWMDDINTHIQDVDETGYILGSRIKRNGDIRYDFGKEKFEDLKTLKMYGGKTNEDLPFYIITNIESIRYEQTQSNTNIKSKSRRRKKTYPVGERIIELIHQGEISMIAIDEVHLNMSPSSINGQIIHQIFKETDGEVEWIPMSGTPITKQPTDAFLPLKLVHAHEFNDYWNWCQHFCIYGGYGGHDIVGYKNIPELRLMFSMNMIRRLKSEVHDMPPKNKIIEYVENTPTQKKLYSMYAKELKDKKDYVVNKHMNGMVEFLKLRQINGSPELVDPTIQLDDSYIKKNAKIERLFQLLTEIIDIRGEKVVIFSNWVDPLRTLYKFVSKKYKVCCFTGSMKEDVRQKHKRVFINNPNYHIIMGTIGALGTTHTLTVANNVIFYDEPWNPTDREQCEDRIYGLNTTKTANIYTIITRDTVDNAVHSVINNKQMISDYVVDGNLNIRKNPELFDKLLGEI